MQNAYFQSVGLVSADTENWNIGICNICFLQYRYNVVCKQCYLPCGMTWWPMLVYPYRNDLIHLMLMHVYACWTVNNNNLPQGSPNIKSNLWLHEWYWGDCESGIGDLRSVGHIQTAIQISPKDALIEGLTWKENNLVCSKNNQSPKQKQAYVDILYKGGIGHDPRASWPSSTFATIVSAPSLYTLETLTTKLGPWTFWQCH